MIGHIVLLRHWIVILTATACVAAAPRAQGDDSEERAPRGVIKRADDMASGYTLISPFSANHAYLIDADGKVVHQWESRYRPGLAPYLLPNGNLLRGIQVGLSTRFQGGGISGGLQEFDWDGNLLWEFHLASDLRHHHHDIEPMPGGNFLMIAWESKTKQQALDAGRLPDYANDAGIWPDAILEIEPLRPFGARVIWEWHVWDHLIQDVDPKLPNYGVVADHPERFDVNGDIPRAERKKSDDDNDDDDADDQQQQNQRRRNQRTDWLHFNGVDYNAELDQIVISSHALSEIWIIDHSTTTEEAAGSTGGRAGRGGDLLYRWGNPQVYNRGDANDQQLFRQHDPQWIPKGFPGEDRITIFNNGAGRTGGENYSTVVEIATPLQPGGTYACEDGEPFGPEEPHWQYNPDKDERFFASFISGAHRLPNGNTLICSGPDGRLLEVTHDGEVAWEYKNPFALISGDNPPNDATYNMFRATRIPPDHPALQGKALAPLDPQPKTAEQLFAERPTQDETLTGWNSLTSVEDGAMPPWATMLGVQGQTHRLQPDPDNDDSAILVADGESTNIVRSYRKYENFIFECQWRLTEEGGDAGVLVWADPLPAVGAASPRGVEIDIHSGEDAADSSGQGAIFAVGGAQMTPSPQFRVDGDRSIPNEDDAHVRPAGEWNRYRITTVDGAVTLEVNGHVVAGGLNCQPAKGYLCLVSERGEVQFRNVRIWELPAGSHSASSSAAADAAGHQPLYSGVDLDGWNVVRGDWQADDWRLTCGAGSSEIEIELSKAAKHVCFDFKRTSGPGEAGTLPLEVGGGARFDAAGEIVGQWNRVHLHLTDAEIAVEFGGERQTVPRNEGETLRLALVNDGAAAEFANVFVRE